MVEIVVDDRGAIGDQHCDRMGSMRYKSFEIERVGGPEVLRLTESPLRAPNEEEVRLRVHYTGVGFTDILMCYGNYPYAPPMPFVPGYEVVGVVDAVGAEVRNVSEGQRVAALTVHGGYSEYIYLEHTELVPVPDEVDGIEAVSLILNYVTAYQMLHRIARAEPGQVALITGAGGGVGNALLQLGKLTEMGSLYGLSSPGRHSLVERLGGIPIDYRKGDFRDVIRRREPQGVDAVFDGIGGAFARRGYRLLRPGGTLVAFGITGSLRDGRAHKLASILSYLVPFALNAVPDGRRATFYGITRLYRSDPNPFRTDLEVLFRLVSERRLEPVVADVMPLTDAPRALQRLADGGVNGKLVLQCTQEGEPGRRDGRDA